MTRENEKNIMKIKMSFQTQNHDRSLSRKKVHKKRIGKK